ncbi:MAG: hypothetical protein ACXWZV_03430 [Solirubrobacterales bacterium]
MKARRCSRRFALAAATLAAGALAAAPGAAADTTIGADVNGPSTYTGACGGSNPSQRPCTVVNTIILGRTVRARCDGTVTRFRLNGIATANTYRLRIVHDNGDGTFTSNASSNLVTITSDGVHEYPTSLPIKQGDYPGLDFMDSTTGGVLGNGDVSDGVFEHYFYAFPADGIPDTPDGFNHPATYHYNADVACGGDPGKGGQSGQAKKCKKRKGKKSAATAKKKKCKKKGKRR